MFLSSSVPLTQKQKSSLHLLLVFGIVLYVYTPLLDHWLEREHYTRPHTHIHLPESFVIGDIEDYFIGDIEDYFSKHSDHQEGILCLLDIKTLIYVIPNINVVFVVQDIPLVFGLTPYSVHASNIYLPSLDPPPKDLYKFT